MNKFLFYFLSIGLLVLGFMAGAALFFVLLIALGGAWLLFKVRSLWGRVTGRPVSSPWVMGRFDPRTGFQRTYDSFRRPAQTRRAAGRNLGRDADITDVTPKEHKHTE